MHGPSLVKLMSLLKTKIKIDLKNKAFHSQNGKECGKIASGSQEPPNLLILPKSEELTS